MLLKVNNLSIITKLVTIMNDKHIIPLKITQSCTLKITGQTEIQGSSTKRDPYREVSHTFHFHGNANSTILKAV